MNFFKSANVTQRSWFEPFESLVYFANSNHVPEVLKKKIMLLTKSRSYIDSKCITLSFLDCLAHKQNQILKLP